MYNSNPPEKADLPSTARLIKSTLLAAAAAAVLLVTVVMPAEYGIDPTGIGKMVGLKKMGEIKTSLARDAAAEEAKELAAAMAPAPAISEPVAEPAPPPSSMVQTDETVFTLAPDAWTEIKLKMNKGATVNYVWFTDTGRANFDIHGDSRTLEIDYHGYGKGSTERDEGTLEAAFDGSHGWFWRNRAGKTITITLQTSGEYQDIVVMK